MLCKLAMKDSADESLLWRKCAGSRVVKSVCDVSKLRRFLPPRRAPAWNGGRGDVASTERMAVGERRRRLRHGEVGAAGDSNLSLTSARRRNRRHRWCSTSRQTTAPSPERFAVTLYQPRRIPWLPLFVQKHVAC